MAPQDLSGQASANEGGSSVGQGQPASSTNDAALGVADPITSTESPVSTSATSATSTSPLQATIPSQQNGNSAPDKGGTGSTAALAGGIAGALIAGLLIGMVVSLLWSRFRNRGHRRGGRNGPALEKHLSFSKNPTETSRAVTGDSDDDSTAWQVHLPQPIDDSSLRRSVKTLYHQIDLHVENFYVDTDTGHTPEDDTSDSELQHYETNLLSTTLRNALAGTQGKRVIIKHCLTHLILSRIDPECPVQYSFLAPEVGALSHAIAGASGTAAQGQRKKEKRVFDEAYAQHRLLTGYLLDVTLHSGNTSANPTTFQTAAAHFEAAFSPWISSSAKRDTHTTSLTGIMRHAADLGSALAVQPNLFRFLWSKSGGQGGVSGAGSGSTNVQNDNVRGTEVAPVLYKMTDTRGRRLPQPQVMVEGVRR